jgi:hypothetical protein
MAGGSRLALARGDSRRSGGSRAGAAAAWLCALVAVASPARADLDGRWRQSALREDWTVQQWLPGCGPAPQSMSTGGGEVVQIRTEGDELAFVGGGRVFRSNQCYDPMPNLARETHSRDPNGKTWRTRCTTPANDPRKAILNTLVVATSDTHIDVIETGRYEIVLENGRCMADVKRTRGYELVQDEPPKPTATAPAPAPPPAKVDPKPASCTDPGEPARLEVRPSKKLLRTGEAFEFRPIVLDAKGCATKTPTTWKIAAGAENKGVTVDPKGKVTVAADAPEGSVEIVATAAGKETRVTIEVSSPAHYDDLLARSGLNASGETDVASVVSIGSQAVGAGEGRVEDRARARRFVFIGGVGGLLLVLGVLAIVLQRRAKRAAALAREAEERHDARMRDALERKKRRADEHAAQQRAHEESVARAREMANAPPSSAVPARPGARAEDLVCPTCGREFHDVTTFCPHDGTKLVRPGRGATVAMPMVEALARSAPPPSKRGKICPTCGERFDGGADFCGKDGTQLVLLN